MAGSVAAIGRASGAMGVVISTAAEEAVGRRHADRDASNRRFDLGRLAGPRLPRRGQPGPRRLATESRFAPTRQTSPAITNRHWPGPNRQSAAPGTACETRYVR